MKRNVKRLLAFMMAFAVAMTTVLSTDVASAYAASKSKTVKSVTLKIGSSKVTKKTKTMYVGTSATIKVTVNPSTAKKSVTFKSSKKTVATVSSKGKVSAKKAGTAKITVTVKGKDGKSKSTYCNIKVKNVEAKSVKLSQTTATIRTGSTVTLKATVSPTNTTVKTVKWSTSNSKVATVSAKGVVTANAAGTAIITAKCGTKTAKCTVVVPEEVPNVPVTGVTISKDSLEVAVSATSSLTATVNPENATNSSVTWTSADPTIATVDQNGNVKGIATGKTTVRVTTADGGFYAECAVKVTGTSNKNAASVSIDIANSIEGYDNTVLTGTDADVRVRVLDEDGNPVGNTEVTLTSVCNKYGNGSGLYGIKNADVAKTDADGYVDYVYGLYPEYSYTSTDPYFESYVLKATVVGSSVNASTTLSFGFIDLSGIEVLNNRDLDPANDIIPSDNAVGDEDGIFDTMAIGGCRNNEYVNSQQVSKDGTTEHAVSFSADPYLVIPATSGDVTTDDYELPINKSSTAYSVYNDIENNDTTTVIKDVPAGLQYATLNFSNVNLSEYTKIDIETYNAETNGLIESYQMYSDSNTSDIKPTASYQLPIQPDVAINVVVSIVSEGQVNDDSNDGYTIKNITGLWASTSGHSGDYVKLEGTVKWEMVDTIYSNLTDMTYDDAQKYIPADSQYLNNKYTYKYEVPVFPYTGDAIITVNDANKGVVAYYLYPTINKYEYQRVSGSYVKVYQNVNIIPDPENFSYEYPGKVAILASSEEINYSKSVGTITTEGNTVTVNSYVSGVTGLKATVSVPNLTSAQLNSTNGSTLYTSVQWAPTPNAEDLSDDFYALLGQQVTVTAQLLDANGNVKKESGSTIDFTYGAVEDGTKITATDIGKVLGDTGVTLVTGTKLTTDENGQAKLILKSSDYSKFITLIKAKSKEYNVQLSIGGQNTVLANVYWVDAGLQFTDKVERGNVGSKSWQSWTNSNTILKNKEIDARNVGTHWIFGYEVVGRVGVTGTHVLDITNIPVNITKDSIGEMNTEGCANGVANLYSEKTGTTNLTGSITNETYDEANKAVFTILKDNEELQYVNVGTGMPTIKSSLTIPVSWSAIGVNISVVSPLGNALDKNTSTTAYIKVCDNFGNPVKDRDVKYTVTGLNEMATNTATTNEYGLVEIKLPAPTKWTTDMYTTTISASTDDDQIVAEPLTIQYSQSAATKFALVNAKLDDAKSTADKDVVEVTFSVPVKLANKSLFAVKANGTTYPIESAEISSSDARKVLLTLNDKAAISNLTTATDITVSVASEFMDEADGITYKAIDQNGTTLLDTYRTVTFTRPADYKITAEYVNGKINVSIKNGTDDVTFAGTEVYAVADVASVFTVNKVNQGVVTGSGIKGTSTTITANPTDKDSTVRIYFRGVEKEVVVSAAN